MLTDAVAGFLDAHKARQDAERAKAGDAWQDNDLVFCTSTGRPLASGNVRRDFGLLLDRAGVNRKGFHSLRHAYATLARAAGVDLADIADALGHASVAFTARCYAHATTSSRKAAADRFSAFVDGA